MFADPKLIFLCFYSGILLLQLYICIKTIHKICCSEIAIKKYLLQEIIAIICFISSFHSCSFDIAHLYICYTKNYVVFTIKHPIDIIMSISDLCTLISYSCVMFTWYLRIYIPFKLTKYKISICYHIFFWVLTILSMISLLLMVIFYFINPNDAPNNETYQMTIEQKYNMSLITLCVLLLSISLLYLLISKLIKIYVDNKSMHIKRYYKPKLSKIVNGTMEEDSHDSTINAAETVCVHIYTIYITYGLYYRNIY